MNKIILFLVFSLLNFSVYSSEEKDNQVEIWTSNENIKKALDELSADFAKNFNTQVNVTILNKDLTTQFKTAALTGKGPDILCWANDVIGELAASGIIEPVILPTKLKKSLIPVAVDAFTYQGKVYGYPYDLESVAFIYNKDLLPTPPENLEDMIKIHNDLQMKNKENYGFLYDINNFFFSFPLLTANGGYIFKNEKAGLNVKDIGLNNEGTLAGVDFIKRLVDEKVVPSSVDRSIAFGKMKEGKLAATIDGPWSLTDLRKSGINYGIAPIPNLKNNTPRPFVGAHGFIIRSSSNKIDLAKELIERHFMSRKGISVLYKYDPRGPARVDSLNELSNSDQDLRNFMASAKVGTPMPNVPEMGAVWGSMGSALNFVTTGRSTPESALNQAVRQIKATLNP